MDGLCASFDCFQVTVTKRGLFKERDFGAAGIPYERFARQSKHDATQGSFIFETALIETLTGR